MNGRQARALRLMAVDEATRADIRKAAGRPRLSVGTIFRMTNKYEMRKVVKQTANPARLKNYTVDKDGKRLGYMPQVRLLVCPRMIYKVAKRAFGKLTAAQRGN